MGLIDRLSFAARGARGGDSAEYGFVMTTCCERVGVIDDSRRDLYFNHENLGAVAALEETYDCPFCDAPVWDWKRIEDLEHVPDHWRWACDGPRHAGRRRVRSLEEHVGELLSLNQPLPEHDSLRILDTSSADVRREQTWVLPRSALLTVAQFAPRFDALLRAGYAWLNLSVYGVFESSLIVGVERPAESAGVPAGLTSVNYSGPPRGSDWALQLVLRE